MGHAPFSHTGESLYLGGPGNTDYTQIHDELANAVGMESFKNDLPTDSNTAAPHEIMSAIVGITAFSKFISSSEERDFSKTPIIFNSSSDEIIETDFETVAKPLQPNQQGRKKFYYLFYRRNDNSEEIDKAKLCERLAGQFSTAGTKKRRRS